MKLVGSARGSRYDRIDPEKLMLVKKIPLNTAQELDIEEMDNNIPELRFGMEATRGWAFCHPPEIKWDKLDTVLDEYIISEYIVPFRWEAYKRQKRYGIVPYKPRTVGEYIVPVIPMIGSGTIWQYYDIEDETMVYLWYPRDRPFEQGPDPDMRFHVWYPPTFDGNYTSPYACALRTWKMAKIVTSAGSRAVTQGSDLPQFLVHTPPKGRPGDEKFQIQFGDAEELAIDRDKHNRELEKQEVSRGALRAAVAHARGINAEANVFYDAYRSPVLNSEKYSEKVEREGKSVLDRLVELDAHWNVASADKPVLLADPLEYEKRVGTIVSSLVDLPLSMVMEQHAQHSGNFDAQIAFARDRMKAIIVDMNAFLKKVILDINHEELNSLYVKKARSIIRAGKGQPTEEELIQLHAAYHTLTVTQRCTPLVRSEQIIEAWEYGAISQESMAAQLGHHYGLPEEIIQVTPLKRQRELEMDTQKLAEKSAKSQNELGAKKLELDAAKSKEDAKAKKAKTAASSK